MKNKKVLAIIILVVLAFYGFSAWGQYTWRDRFVQSAGSDWVVFDEQKNAADIIFPYTFFITPVNRLGLIQKSSIKEISNDIYTYNLMWTDGPIGNSMPTEEFLSFADCNRNLEGNLKKGTETFTSINDIEWTKPSDNPYVRDAKEKEQLVQKFEKKCEILRRNN